MGAVTNLFDGLINVVANLGTSRDKASANDYHLALWDDARLLTAYRTAWLPRKIVDIPAFDACRKWRLWNASNTIIELIENEEKRLNVKEKTLKAMIVARLFGGAALLIGNGDIDPSKPLIATNVKKGGLKYLTVLTKQQCTAGEIDLDVTSELFGKPKYYTINTSQSTQTNVHPSRLVLFIGSELPDIHAAQAHGWGDSVLASVIAAVLQADGTSANIASLVFEAKVDTIGIPQLMTRIQDRGYEASLMKRFALAETGKSINGTLLHDSEEVIGQKTASFSTLPDIMDRFYQNVSGAADIPMTRLFGRSPAGLSATGDSDIRNYYDRIQSIQMLEMSPAMRVLDDVLIYSATGKRDPSIHYEWASLWQTSEKERAEIGKITADTIKTLADSGIFPDEVLSKAGANALVETGTLSGLEAAIEEFGLDVEADSKEDIIAALPSPFKVKSEPIKNTVADEKPIDMVGSFERIARAMPAPIVNVDVKPSNVNVEPSPVTVNTPAVTVQQPSVTVNVPDISLPPVNVTVQPAQIKAGDIKVDVHIPEQGATETTVEELDDKGRVVSTVDASGNRTAVTLDGS